jgi:methyl-accepting chemotaxis protein
MSAASAIRLPRRTVRLLAWMLAIYGLLGLLLVGAALMALGPLLARASVAADSAGDSLAAAATALDHTATAFDGFGHSLDDARTSSAHASQLLKDASATSAQLADAMSLNIFGAQPLLPIAQTFRRNTDELRGVSEDLNTMSEAIGHNSRDVTTVRDDLKNLRDRVSQLARDAAASKDGPRVEPALRVLVYGLTIWLGLLATASFVAGAVLLRL